MNHNDEIACLKSVLSTFDQFRSVKIGGLQFLGNNGGFSGATLWRFSADGDRQTNSNRFVLRRFPATANRIAQRIRWSHEILETAKSAGCRYLPVPVKNRSGETLTQSGIKNNFLWQIEPWMPGRADFRELPTNQRLKSAVEAIALFHRSVVNVAPANRQFPGGSPHQQMSGKKSALPSVVTRLQRFDDFSKIDQRVLESSANRYPTALKVALLQDAVQLCRQFHILSSTIRVQLESFRELHFEQSPCLRDVWHDHVLFESDDVSGIVDLSAINFDNRATDIARLVGSLVGDDGEKWSLALSAYENILTLSESERELARLLDRSGNLLSGMQWLAWIFGENRQFEDPQRILARFGRILKRTQFLIDSLGKRTRLG